MTDLQTYLVEQVPPSVYYIPGFITAAEEDHIIQKVYSSPKPKWTQLLNRRLQNWGGIPHTNGMIIEKIPEWLSKYIDKVNQLKLFNEGAVKANHVLVNEYLKGQGIMPHTDGPLFYPTICTISCGSHTVLEFEPKEVTDLTSQVKISLLLEPRSLVVIKDSMYTFYLHSISERTQDFLDDSVANLQMTGYKTGDIIQRTDRVSLTIRNVLKTSKLQIKLSK